MSRDLLVKLTAIDGYAGTKKAFYSHITNDGSNPEDFQSFLADDVYLSSRFLDRTVRLPLDEAQKKELIACIADDVTAQSAEDRYFTAKPEVCILDFASEGASLSNGFPDWSERVVVTESFVKTVQFLNNNGLLASLPAPAEVDFLEVESLFSDSDYRFEIQNNPMMPLLTNNKQPNGSAGSKEGATKITDAAQISAILQASRAQYLAVDGGYIVSIHYKGEDFVTSAFLPMKNAPDFVRQTVK